MEAERGTAAATADQVQRLRHAEKQRAYRRRKQAVRRGKVYQLCQEIIHKSKGKLSVKIVFDEASKKPEQYLPLFDEGALKTGELKKKPPGGLKPLYNIISYWKGRWKHNEEEFMRVL